MGCGSSTPKGSGGPPPPTEPEANTGAGGAALNPSHGGSMLIDGSSGGAAAQGKGQEGQDASGDDEGGDREMAYGKGSSIIVGRKVTDSWEPGEPVDGPPVITSTRRIYTPWPPDTTRSLGRRAPRVLRISYGYFSIQGRNARPPHKANQDSLVVVEGLGSRKDTHLFAVFDGHGPVGEVASQFCRVNLSDVIVKGRHFKSDPRRALARAFPKLQDKITAMEPKPNADMTYSGSTAVAVMIHGDQLTCANVGDSRAVLCSEEKRPDRRVCRPLSQDHKPGRADERSRMQRAPNCEIHSERQILGRGDSNKLYVCRRNGPSIQYAILFTRSVGDLDAHENLGVIPDAEVKTTRLLPEQDRFVILASDGVWDFIDNETAAAIVEEVKDPQAAAEELANEARSHWNRFAGGRRDDITVIVLRFKWMTDEDGRKDEARYRRREARRNREAGGSASRRRHTGEDEDEDETRSPRRVDSVELQEVDEGEEQVAMGGSSADEMPEDMRGEEHGNKDEVEMGEEGRADTDGGDDDDDEDEDEEREQEEDDDEGGATDGNKRASE